MVARNWSASLDGVEGVSIEIEASLRNGAPRFLLSGLAGDVVRESRERVRACLHQHGVSAPSGQLTVHLSPAQTKKQGAQFDLAIAVAVLAAEQAFTETIPAGTALLGELSLDGRVQGVDGAVSLLEALERHPDVVTILAPEANEPEALLLGAKKVRLVRTFADAISFLRGEGGARLPVAVARPSQEAVFQDYALDLLRGQTVAKRALAIALAGKHHLLFAGPPGVGKSSLAHAASQLLPPLNREEAVRVRKNHGTLRGVTEESWRRPFRAPHHSISAAALLGGGSATVVPGEVTFADQGILFLDELPEFSRDALEGLREPLQDGVIRIHRIGRSLELPATFTLLATMNPCPCGLAFDRRGRCRCRPGEAERYRRKLSGPLLDRVDLFVALDRPLPRSELSPEFAGATIARKLRDLSLRRVERAGLPWSNAAERASVAIAEAEQLSPRALAKSQEVARTIAWWDGAQEVGGDHVTEAALLRMPERPFAEYAGR